MWFFRAMELADGRWGCRHGMTDYDIHETLDDAVAHLRELASETGPAVVFAHWLDGTVERLGEA